MSYQNPDDGLAPILDAARRLLDKGEPEGFTMGALAHAVGLSRATLYRRVGSREALLHRLADEDGLKLDHLGRANIRDRVLQAVRRVLHTTGSFNITVEQIAAEAGVGVATVYRHFGDKESLLQAFSEELTPRRDARELLLHAGPDVAADLTHFATGVLTFLREYEDLSGFMFVLDEKSQQLLGHLQSTQDRTLLRLKRYFASQVRHGRLRPADPFDLATAFAGMLIGLTVVRLGYREAPSGEPAVMARFIVDLFLRGALPGAGQEESS